MLDKFSRLDTSKLYNKYRPKLFRDVVGQSETISILRGLLVRGRVPVMKNFILHSSIGGVGKTLLARIMGKALNCEKLTPDGEPCGECESCRRFETGEYPDYMEFNAADWNTVDRAKVLAELSRQMPVSQKGSRVIVIDEFQRVSPQGQDTLLKVLEEGSSPNIFIFCTTEYESIRGTIRTRCFPLEIRPILSKDIYSYLEKICRLENITYEVRSLEKISLASRGSLREAVKLVELFQGAYGNISNTDTLSYKYSVIAKSLVDAIMGRVPQAAEELTRLGEVDWVEDTIHVLWDLLMFRRGLKPEYLGYEECERIYRILEHNLDFIEQEFSYYRPGGLSLFLLFLQRIQAVEESSRGPGMSKVGRKKRWSTLSKNFDGPDEGDLVPPPQKVEMADEDVNVDQILGLPEHLMIHDVPPPVEEPVTPLDLSEFEAELKDCGLEVL